MAKETTKKRFFIGFFLIILASGAGLYFYPDSEPVKDTRKPFNLLESVKSTLQDKDKLKSLLLKDYAEYASESELELLKERVKCWDEQTVENVKECEGKFDNLHKDELAEFFEKKKARFKKEEEERKKNSLLDGEIFILPRHKTKQNVSLPNADNEATLIPWERTNEFLAFSPDGEFLLTGNNVSAAEPDKEQTLILWDIASKEIGQKFHLNNFPANRAIFSPNGKFILTLSYGRSKTGSKNYYTKARLLSVANGEIIRSFEKIEYPASGMEVENFSFSSDSRLWFFRKDDNILKLWDASSGKFIRFFEGIEANIQKIIITNDMKQVFFVAKEPFSLTLYDIVTGEKIPDFEGVKGDGRWVSYVKLPKYGTLVFDDSHTFSPNGRYDVYLDTMFSGCCGHKQTYSIVIDDLMNGGRARDFYLGEGHPGRLKFIFPDENNIHILKYDYSTPREGAKVTIWKKSLS